LVELLFPEWKSLIHVKGEGQPYVCDSLFWEPHMHGVILFWGKFCSIIKVLSKYTI
jgi:hypothetical protein